MAAPAKKIIPHQALHQLVTGLFTARGLRPDDARTVADVLVWANLRGVDSHGVSRVPRYMELFDKGESKPQAQPSVQRLRSAVAVVDADSAPGPVALTAAMREAIEMAREAGVAWVAVRGTVHTGAIGYYTSLAAQAGMAGLGIVAGVPNMAYAGGRGAGVATSPLSVALPADRHPEVLLDMATAVIALGKIAQYKTSGQPLPEGAALDADGVPTTDPATAKVPLPVGGAKGAGMSLVFELLASGLTANPIVSSYHSGSPDGRRHRQNATLVAVDISAFVPVKDFVQTVDETLDVIKALPATDPSRELLIPGERGARTYAQRSAAGVPLGGKVWASLTEEAVKAGVPVPELP
jgi:LDH2 family malate/lactate/ureidoglycolate dehydrogenase